MIGSVDGYRRILDFKNGTADTGLYVLGGKLSFYSVAEAPSSSVAVNTFVQVVLTRDAAKKVIGYVNGVKQLEFTDSSDLGLIDNNNTLRFFKDNNFEASAGSVARIRLYNGPLSASEVAALDRLPSGTGASECLAPPSGMVGW